MTAKRDSLALPASIGRAQGASIARTPSREALAVHPLLSSAPLSAPPSSAPLDSSSGAKYVPYTPRQRPAPTGSPVQAAVTPSQGCAPGKPQLVNLRAAAQNIGLDVSSIGWAILEKISYEGDTSDEWSEIWNALTKGRATLLLPLEPSSGHDAISPEFVQDHLIVCDLASRENTAVITLSGLRGQLVHDTLTFRSTLHRYTKHFQGLISPSAPRAASLDALPPLPAYPPESSYPSFTVSACSTVLPLPLRATKPPLPPRPGVRGAPTPSAARLSMPFASLFGQRPSTPPPQFTPTTPTTIATPPIDADPVIDVSAFVIDTVVSRADIATGIISALQGEIAIALNDQPPWVVERVHTFAHPYFPFVKVPAGKKKLQDIGGNSNRVTYAVNRALDKAEELADKFQAFYRAVESELRNGGHVRVEEGTRGDGLDTGGPQDPEPVGEREGNANEAQIRNVLETIESTLCTLLYDRLFLPPTSDDSSHNEALSSRVAALTMLDLGLEHLDVDIGDANQAEVDAVVRACGQVLAQLDLTARSPREKADVLVSAHKLVVEGLSKIPPVRLRSRSEDNKHPAELSPLGHAEIVERDSATSTSTTPLASVHIPLSPEQTEKQSPLILAARLPTSPDQLPATKPPPSPDIVSPSLSSPVSGDVLLPILIFSVVKANPPKLVSHLLFTQRFRNQSFGGEESYCLINLMAVAEFLENVDLGALGLGESEKKVLSTADLTPIPITAGLPPAEEHPVSIRGVVGQGVDAIAGSANKVILGVVDSSFGVLRALLPGQTPHGGSSSGTGAVEGLARGSGSRSVAGLGAGTGTRTGTGTGAGPGAGETDAALWSVRPSLGLLRRETGFSIAGLTAAFPGPPGKARSQGHGYGEEEGQRELVEVSSRPMSLRSHQSGYDEGGSEDTEGSSGGEGEGEGEGGVRKGSGDEEGGAEEGKEDGVDEEEKEEEEEEEEEEEVEVEAEEVHDTRSIKSFESMLSGGRTKRRTVTNKTTAPLSASTKRRKRLSDLTDRLTHGMAGMSRRVQGGDAYKAVTPSGRLPPPNRRFLERTEQDIRVSEVGELLREYQRLVEAVRSVGGFQE